MSNLWPPLADAHGAALHDLRMESSLYTRSEFTAAWGLALPPMPGHVMFHAVTSGRAWLEVDGAPARALQPGDLALVPQGAGHRLASEPGGAAQGLFDLPREQVSERYEVLRHGGGGAPTTMLCGVVRFGHPTAQALIHMLPPTIVVDAWATSQAEWMHGTLRLLVSEAEQLRPGGEAVITRLADILVLQAIRFWIERDPAAQHGWLGALRDPQVGRVISAIHRRPDVAWTLSSLAAEAAMSRSAFAARFTELVGEPAMHYVTRTRMQVARGALQDGQATIAELAARLGYQSEAAFSRAFKRCVGVSPGAARRASASDGAALTPGGGVAPRASRLPRPRGPSRDRPPRG
jgi:AraC-like DNA-binding protein